jgi:hypothetical protein
MKKQKKSERHTFSAEELQRLEKYSEVLTNQKEIIGLLDSNSGSFADWLVIIGEAVHEAMAKKQQSNLDCEKERKMLENVTFLFTKMAYFSGTLSDWHKELTVGLEHTQMMIEECRP